MPIEMNPNREERLPETIDLVPIYDIEDYQPQAIPQEGGNIESRHQKTAQNDESASHTEATNQADLADESNPDLQESQHSVQAGQSDLSVPNEFLHHEISSLSHASPEAEAQLFSSAFSETRQWDPSNDQQSDLALSRPGSAAYSTASGGH